MDTLFSKEQEELGNIILEDNYNELDLYYKKNSTIDAKKLIIFAAESGAFNIVLCLLKNYSNEYKKLNEIEKECFYITIFKTNYFNEDMKTELINYCITKFQLSYKLKKMIFILMLKGNHFALYNILKNQPIKYSRKDFLDILKYVNFTTPKNHELLFSHLLKIYPDVSGIFTPLINYVESYNDLYSFTIAFYENLPMESRLLWVNYLFKSNNLQFHAHQTHQEMLKINGFNKLDLNVDFIYFVSNYVVNDCLNIDVKKIDKLKRLITDLRDDKSFGDFLIPIIKNLESLLLKNNFEKILNTKEQEKNKRNKI